MTENITNQTTRTMKAALLNNLNQPLEMIDLPIKAPKAGQVLVKLEASGICHTQLLEISGENVAGAHNPNLLGHEGSGIVEEVGEGVSKVKKGDHVILSWIKGSGANVLPDKYILDGREINAGFVTTFNEYCLASENRVTPIPKEMPLEEAALIGCAVATGAGAVFNNAKVQPGQSVMVIGAGGVGINMIHAASIAGADPIIAVDINDSKLELSRKLGATHTVNSLKEKVAEKVVEIAGKEGLDYAFEAVGIKETMELCYNLVKKNSGRTLLCGVPKPGMKIEIDPLPLYYGRKLVGTGGGETNPDLDFAKFCQMYLEGKIKLKEMITHVLPLEEINHGIELMKRGECCRVIISFKKNKNTTQKEHKVESKIDPPIKKKYKLIYDRNDCIGVLTCAAFYPDRWKINQEDGKADLVDGQEEEKKPGTWILEFTEEELEQFKLSAQACPVNIIHIEDLESGERLI